MKGLADISVVTAMLPPRILIHGLEGMGKTTLGAAFPEPVFIAPEDGCPTGLSIASFGTLSTYADVRDAIGVLGNETHQYQTVVIDTVDKLEGLIWEDICKVRGWQSIESPGYGKGYVDADAWWRDFLKGLDWLRRERGMMVVLLAHSQIDTINDPRAPSYTSYQLRLHKQARGLIADEIDAIGFLSTDLVIQNEQQGFGKTRTRADTSSTRYLHMESKPAFVAKNRYGMPAKIRVPKDFDFASQLAPFFPSAASGSPNHAANTNTQEIKYERRTNT